MSINTPQTPSEENLSQGTPPLPTNHPQDQTAAQLIREKVARIYGEEPDAQQELDESEIVRPRSKHQQFMYDLGTSGKDLATIQTEWHTYYQGLPDDDKHQVWQEFYSSQSLLSGHHKPKADSPQKVSEHKHQAARPKRLRDARTTQELQASIRHTVTAGGKLEAKHHLQSLFFGLSMGFVVIVVFLFSFFNEVFLAPFIQPSKVAASTPLIVNSDSVASSNTPEIVIPKINVQIPVDYTQTSVDNGIIEKALDNGIVHYPGTVRPGETGNAAFFGHSSNNIFNKGKYKFAFVMLRTLVPGDTFYISYNGKVYVYKVITREVVDPSNISVLDAVPGQTATATLITCEPPGTSLKRLVVVGQQISPDPSGNTDAATSGISNAEPEELPGNGPTLWGRFISTWLGKITVVLVLGAALFFAVKRFKPHSIT